MEQNGTPPVPQDAAMTSPSGMPLASRSVTSITWNIVAQFFHLPVSFVQTVLLARLLPVEFFGITEGMTAVGMISYTLFEFGMTGAFFHRSPETEDESKAAAAFFTLRLIFTAIWSLLLIGGSLLFLTETRQMVLLIYATTGFLSKVLDMPRLILMRRVQHKRLAIIDVLNAVFVFIASAAIALSTRSIWALLISPVVTLIWNVMAMYFWRPIWMPRLYWDAPVMRYFLDFGSRFVWANALGIALDHIDDLWTNIFLGDRALGYYSRAYKIAIYPRLVLSAPINLVAMGTYAELKYARERLSQAFMKINIIMIRTAFLLGGWLALIAPYFTRLLLGEQWLPMVPAYRLMLVFTLLDPIKVTIGSVLIAVGRPEKLSLARIVQFFVLLVCLFALGLPFGIQGVALGVDVMLFIGMALLLHFVRQHIDFSLTKLFFSPLLALLVGVLFSLALNRVDMLFASDLLALVTLSVSYVTTFLAVLIIAEGRMLMQTGREIVLILDLKNRLIKLLERDEINSFWKEPLVDLLNKRGTPRG